uniref:Carrier domain-containing protein n=1 Tax=Globodera rostochiensis TaxID=31243 RepID=A0A914I8B1_GLORO
MSPKNKDSAPSAPSASPSNGPNTAENASSSTASPSLDPSLPIHFRHINDNGTPMDDDVTLVGMFRRVCSDPNLRSKVVLQDRERLWTLGELDDITERLARHFVRAFGCHIGSCVAIYMYKCAEYVFAYIAALKAGAAYLPLDISYPEPLLNSVLDEVRPTVVCASEEHAANLSPSINCLVMDPLGKWLDEELGEDKENGGDIKLPGNGELSPDEIAYIVYSSGTTGKPKGIECPHRGAVLSYKWRFRNYPYREDDVVACNVFFVWEMFRPILQATKMVIIPDSTIYDSGPLCDFLRQNRVTQMLFTPSLLEMVLDTQDERALADAFQHMRLVHLCGEVVTCALLDRFFRHFPHVRCANLYSISETHDVAVSNLSEFHSRREKRQFAPVGRVLDGVNVLILDGQTMKRVPIGVPGEIYVAGPTLARGYINRPELNRDRFVEVPAELRKEVGEVRMYRTGDWGYLMPNSLLEICGRCDTMVRIRGYSVELQAIESTLLDMSAVRSCAVVSFGAEGEDKQLAAYIVLRERSVNRKQLRALLKRILPFYMMPQFFVFLDKLPLLPASSKIDRKSLPPVDFERDVVEAEALPQTPTEQKLARIWGEVLHLVNLDVQESFFDLGGHSLLATRLLNKVNAEFCSQLIMRDLFAAPTVYAMGKQLDGAERASPEQDVDLEQQVDNHDLHDNVMDLHLRAFWRATGFWKRRFANSSVFLTGVTGYLGSQLLAELLLKTDTRLTCLIRESSPDETVLQRLFTSLRNNGLLTNDLRNLIRDRVRVVAGDIALFQFGLSDEDYHFLSYDIDVVLHSAAYVNLIYPYQALHGINVLGTRNVIDFCLKNKLKPLHYISTDAVFPSDLCNVDEDFRPETVSSQLTDGYGQSKYVAEQLVLRSLTRGLPGVCYRLGNQAAPSTSGGRWNDRDFTYLMLLGVLCTHKTPDLDWEVELTPVDFSARFVVRVLCELFNESSGKVFHLIGSQAIPRWSELMDWLRLMGFELEQMQTAEWVKMIESSSDPKLAQLQKLVENIFRGGQFQFMQSHFLRSNTDNVLSQLGWQYPVVRPLKVATVRMLLGRVCIVTGASDGIGEAVVRTLALEGGANVVLVARRIERLEALAHQLNAREEVDAMVKQTAQRFGRVDVLVNCAGVMYYLQSSKGHTEEWSRQIDVNIHGTTNVVGFVLPLMVERKNGHILTITSDAGRRAFPGLAVYSGTKFYLEAFISALRQENVENGIRFTNIQPGDVATSLAGRSSDVEARKKYDTSEAGHKILDCADVAQSVLFCLTQPSHVAINELLIEPQAAPI